MVTDNAYLVHSALMAGLGVARVPSYFIIEELTAGKLKILFNDDDSATMSIYAMHLSSAISLPKV